MKLISNEVEAAEAVRNILGSRGSEEKKKPRKSTEDSSSLTTQAGLLQSQPNQIFSNLNQSQPGSQAVHQFTQVQQNRIIRTGDSLQKSAEDILAGIKRPTAVEGAVVQFLLPEKQSQIG